MVSLGEVKDFAFSGESFPFGWCQVYVKQFCRSQYSFSWQSSSKYSLRCCEISAIFSGVKLSFLSLGALYGVIYFSEKLSKLFN